MDASEFTSVAAFAAATTPQITRIIAWAQPHFDVVRWGSLLQEGMWNYVAHKLALELGGRSGLDATVTTKGVGKVNVGRDARLGTENPFNRTIYGQEYWRLCKLVGLGGLAVGTGLPAGPYVGEGDFSD